MPVASKANPNPVVELKSAALTLVAVVVRTADLDELAQALGERFGDSPEGLDGEPVAIDLAALRDTDAAVDIVALIDLLRGHAMRPIAVRGGSPAQMEAAHAAGLVEAHSATPARPEAAAPAVPAPPPTPMPAELTAPPAAAAPAGPIHVYAPLRGRAIAGAQGNAEARIFATCMEPQLVSIAGTYRTTETELPPDVLGKPAQVRLVGERLVVEALAS